MSLINQPASPEDGNILPTPALPDVNTPAQPGDGVKTQHAMSCPRVSDATHCISNQFPGNAEAAGLGTTL